jgi:hypothetical protein
LLGKPEVILYKSIINRLLRDQINLSKFEKAIVNAAVLHGYPTVICGHTHIPRDNVITTDKKFVRYINCGDWVEHFTAAEYYNEEWHLWFQNEPEEELQSDEAEIPEDHQLYQLLVKELASSNLI